VKRRVTAVEFVHVELVEYKFNDSYGGSFAAVNLKTFCEQFAFVVTVYFCTNIRTRYAIDSLLIASKPKAR
jgi:hypothetical protein